MQPSSLAQTGTTLRSFATNPRPDSSLRPTAIPLRGISTAEPNYKRHISLLGGSIVEQQSIPVAAVAAQVAPRPAKTIYPEPFASRVAGRTKRALGDLFGLKNFGVNLTTLAPKAVSALRHAHAKQDEFIYVLEGTPTLYTDEGATRLSPGMCAGFRCATGNAHHLVNETNQDVVYLEIGDR